jgi:hypothetical protein
VQLGRPLPLFFDAHAKGGLEAPGRVDDVLSNLAADNPLLRRVPHPKLTASNIGRGDNLKVGQRHEVADFQLALAHDCQGRRLHPANPDHTPGPSAQNDRRGPGQRQVVNLVGLPARDGGGVKAGIFRVGLRPGECVADGPRILRGEQHSHYLATIPVMLEDLLADQLTLAITVGRQPDPFSRAQRLSNGFELGGFVAALGRPGAVKTLGPQQDR